MSETISLEHMFEVPVRMQLVVKAATDDVDGGPAKYLSSVRLCVQLLRPVSGCIP